MAWMTWQASETLYGRLPVAGQEMVIAWRGRRILRDRFGPGYEELRRLLDDSEWYDRERLRSYQDGRLQALIVHAYETVPYYRDVMDARRLKPSDVRTAHDLTKLPVLLKEDVRANAERLVSRAARRRTLRSAATSATTGAPLSIYWDRAVALMNHACYFRVRRWAGAPFGKRCATLQGRITVPAEQRKPPFWRRNPSWNQIFFSSLHMSAENLPHYVAELRRFEPEVLEVYPSSAYILARFLEARGERLPMPSVITTGEPLLPPERETIERCFGTRVFDAYGLAERVAFSSECDRHEGQHLFEEYGVTEFVDDRGEPVATGAPGRLTGTSLHNFAMPLIRYVTGDVATPSDRVCGCGRQLPMLDGLTAREGDLLVTPDGRLVPPVMVSWAVRFLRDCDQWQIVQESRHEILVRAVTRSPITDEERAGVAARLARHLGASVRTRVERVSEIPLTSRGKIRHVISHVPPLWASG
jgi:phenylacetate-CoA ligase